jgi:hypothetical protein
VAIDRAIDAHPFGMAGGWQVDSAAARQRAERLWAALCALRDGKRLTVIRALDTSEVRLLAYTARARFEQPECLEVLASLIQERDVVDASALSFEAFLYTDGSPSFRTGALAFARMHSTASALFVDIAQSESADSAVAAKYMAQSNAFGDWVASHSVGLSRYSAFLLRVQQNLLREINSAARVEQIERQDVVEYWLTLTTQAHRTVADTAYIIGAHQVHLARSQRLQPWPVRHAALESLLKRQGQPNDSSQFWSSLPAAVRRSVELWLLERQLASFIGEGDRLDFWRQFLPYMQSARENRDKQVVFIRFEEWTAIQFKNTGTATYLYTLAQSRGWDRYREQELQGLVRRHADKALGSYMHRGHVEHWQSRAAHEVRTVLGRMARV